MPRTTERFAGYELERLVGRSESGTIYKARDTRLPRAVALRVISADIAHDPATRARLNREATVLAACEHPNVLPIYEAGEFEGQLYIVSRWVEASTISELVRREGPFEPRRAVAVISRVASALEAAHALGVIHRAVRPSSVLVQDDGITYLTDFGLARRSSDLTGLTLHEQLLDSFDYVAPEYIRGDDVDQRVDIYGLGCVLYEALTGEPPYADVGPTAKMYAHLSADPPSPRAVRPELPEALDAVVRRALAKEPDQRYPTPGAFAQAARAALPGEFDSSPAGSPSFLNPPAGPAPAGSRSRRRARSSSAAAASDSAAPAAASAVPAAASASPAAASAARVPASPAPVSASPGSALPVPAAPSAVEVRDQFDYEVYRPRDLRRLAVRGTWVTLVLIFLIAPIALLITLLH
jgi:serine/threonine protein kinase